MKIVEHLRARYNRRNWLTGLMWFYIDPLFWRLIQLAEGNFSAVTFLCQLFNDNPLNWGKNLNGDFPHFQGKNERSWTFATWDAPLPRNPIFTLKRQPDLPHSLIPFIPLLSFCVLRVVPGAWKKDDYTNLSPRKSKHFISSQTESQWWVMSL